MENLLIATVLCMALDVATGVAGAVKAGALKSGKMREGLWHKAGFFGLIALAYLLEFAASVADLGISVPAVSAVCVFVILTEVVSIVENLCVLNPDIRDSPVGKTLASPGGEPGEKEE